MVDLGTLGGTDSGVGGRERAAARSSALSQTRRPDPRILVDASRAGWSTVSSRGGALPADAVAASKSPRATIATMRPPATRAG